MRKRLAIWALAMAVAAGAQSSDTAETLLQAAIKKEVVDGNLPAAIEGYKKAVAAAKGNRTVASMALVRMAECYEKSGDAQARKLYEQVVRDYGDQKEAVTIARSRLAIRAESHGGGMVAKQLWSSSPEEELYDGGVSPDGRYVPFTNWAEHGDLYLRDLQTGTSRRLTNTAKDDRPGAPGGYAMESCFSFDGKRLAYAWFVGERRRNQIRIIDLQGTGIPQPRVLFEGDGTGRLIPSDWSPDGKAIAIRINRRNQSEIGLLAVGDGSLRVLKSFPVNFFGKILYSPDGQYLAFDAPAGEATLQRDIFVLSLDGGRERALVVDPANDILAGWPADGKHLLFTSDRARSTDLWALPFRNGAAAGPAERVRKDIGEIRSRGTSRSGAFYHQVLNRNPPGRQAVRTATMDFESGRFIAGREEAPGLGGSTGQPGWSPDGKYLFYTSWSKSGEDRALVIRNMEDNQIRIVRVQMSNFVLAATAISAALSPNATSPWWPDGRSLLASGADLNGRRGLFRIDAQTGNVSMVVEGATSYAILAPGGNRIYYQRSRTADRLMRLVSKDLNSGAETVLLSRTRFGFMSLSADGRHIAITAGDDIEAKPEAPMTVLYVPVDGGEARELFRGRQLGAMTMSTDGRYIATGVSDFESKSRIAMLIPVNGDQPRELMRQPAARGLLLALWAPDSRSMFLTVGGNGGEPAELWRVPVDGGGGQKVANVEKMSGAFRISPDRRTLVYDIPLGEASAPSGRPRQELWVLQNFLPASQK